MIKFCKSRGAEQTLNDLDAYLTLSCGEPMRLLEREVRSWGEVSYDELAEVISSGRYQDFIDWRERYAGVVDKIMAPIWIRAIEEASRRATRGQIVLHDSHEMVKMWMETHGGELIEGLSAESRRAVTAIIERGILTKTLPRIIAQEVRPLIGLTSRQAEANANYRARIYQHMLSNGAKESVASERAGRSAERYAREQHRYRAETIVRTETAFAYNMGAHLGVSQAVSDKLMSKCEMIWTTAGVIRTCSRCMELRGKVIGTTDEIGVTLPPLHPRCRCAIEYREVKSSPRFTFDIQRFNDVEAELRRAMTENKIKGELIYPPPILDLKRFTFDVEHTQGDKHPHNVTEKDAQKFINEAYFTIRFKANNSLNYFGKEGAAYVQLGKKKIRTAFKAEEYNQKFTKMIEVYENATRES